MKIGVITFVIRTPCRTASKEPEMATFLSEDFLLDSEFARRLYHDYAAQRKPRGTVQPGDLAGGLFMYS